jgi:8-oxo-dGTP pyrophosphatase MutT (NUDIX family)
VEASDGGPWPAVVRECPEELGIDAVPLEATGTVPFFASMALTRGPGPHTDVSLWYALSAGLGEITGYDTREFAGVGWETPRRILGTPPDTLGPHLHRAVRKLTTLMDPPSDPA